MSVLGDPIHVSIGGSNLCQYWVIQFMSVLDDLIHVNIE